MITCVQCGGMMVRDTKVENSMGLQLLALFLFFLSFPIMLVFPIGTIFGAIMICVSVKMGSKSTPVYRCRKCGYYFERAK